MTQNPTEHLDVIIIGAGISGIAAAYYLSTERPDDSFAVLEARDTVGGTWDLFRYPGIRSDSDLFTLGYRFKPWVDPQAIAPARPILDYLRETVAENGLGAQIRLHHRVRSAAWSSEQSRWSVEIERTDTGEVITLTADWIVGSTGYYRYEAGYTPPLPGVERFRGSIVHPQHWPTDLDYTGQRVVIIGSGATAITLAPAMSDQAALVSLLQRTPTYVLPIPSRDRVANQLRKALGPTRAYALTRRWKIAQQALIWRLFRRFPNFGRNLIRRVNAKQLPDGYDIDTHFNPPYDPWHQRLCFATDGDLFRAIRQGSVEMVTDKISTFTENGIQLASGRHLEADVVVTATGLDLQILGGVAISVDDRPVHLPETVAYKGMMLSGVPNLIFTVGYLNASWTLRVELIYQHFLRLLDYMDEHGYGSCVAETDRSMPLRPLLDFEAGYIQRALDRLPKQGALAPWVMPMEYADDVQVLRKGPVTDPSLHFSDRKKVLR